MSNVGTRDVISFLFILNRVCIYVITHHLDRQK